MKNKGLGLIQILLVIALSAVIALAATRYYSEVKITQKATALWQQAVTITNAVSQCVSSFKPGQTTTTSSMTDYCQSFSNLKKAGYLTVAAQTNPWEGSNGLGVSQQSDSTVIKVWIGADLVPSNICDKLNMKAQEIYTVTQNGTTYTGLTNMNSTKCAFNLYITQ